MSHLKFFKKIAIITIDFDGTCVRHEFPLTGETLPNVVKVLKDLTNNGHKLILWTVHGSDYIDEAINWFKDNNIKLYGVNMTPGQSVWSDSPKAVSNLYIGDDALGTPLVYPKDGGRPYVDWGLAEQLLKNIGFI